jgi:hypothetical protein
VEDFTLHRIECRENHMLWDNEGDTDWQRNARLLIRTYLRLFRPNDRDTACRQGVDGICSCSRQHFRQLEASNNPLDGAELASLQVAKHVLRLQRKILTKYDIPTSTDQQLGVDLENILRRFSVNNFGIVNDMMRMTGSGVYPLAALLNHSCAPNCILRYTGTGVLEVVASCEIAAGVELTHSYVDLVSTTTTRQERLQTTYGFDCTCARCQGWNVPLPSHYLNLETNDVIDWILDKYSQGIGVDNKDSSDAILIDLDGLLQPPPESSDKITDRIQALQHRASLAMANDDDIEGELSLLSEAVDLLVQGSPSPFSLHLYQLRCQRLSSWIVAQKPDEALRDCRHVVGVLCLALSQTPNHPLLGLQLFTLGDLYEACGYLEPARKTHRWARQILSSSLGSENPMVQMLSEKIP